MSLDENKSVSRRFIEQLWNRKDLFELGDLVTDGYTLHVGGGTFAGLDQMHGIAQQWFEPYPDIHAEVLLQVAEGDFVADHILFTGHHTGSPSHPGLFRARGLPPIPVSGRAFEFTQTQVSRFENGRMAETWEDFDRVRLWMQLGVGLTVPAQ